MDFKVADDLATHRAAAKKWVAENVDMAWLDEQHRTGIYQPMALHAVLARDGILAAGWEPEYGGSDVDPDFARAVMEEIARLGFHIDGWVTTSMIINTIKHVGTEEQKQRYIRAALRGEVMISLGYSEPDSGSDMAAAKTTATRDGDEWVIEGQKMFTSSAQVASHVFVLARTDPSAPKHEGLTLFMVPTSSEGYSCHPIHCLGGQLTSATYYADVRVPDDARIGEVNAGWKVMGVALVFERGVGSPASNEDRLGTEILEWSRSTTKPDGTTYLDDPLVASRIGRILIDEEVSRLLSHYSNWKAATSELSTTDSAFNKLFHGEAEIRNHALVMDILGPLGVLNADAPGTVNHGDFEREYRYSSVRTIYGGSSEIMRDMIAQRHLGLPRARPPKD
jgi:alkylation response protein AidB-like acyl-CoA dehydrogenase